MAPKKQKAPKAPASKAAVPKKLTRAEKSAINRAAHRGAQRQVRAELISMKAVVPIGPPVQQEKKAGQPCVYTKKIGETFFDLVATGHTLDSISKRPDMPSMSPLLRWIGDEDHEMSSLYARGKQLLVVLFEERAAMAAIEPEPFTITVRKTGETAAGPVDTVEERVVDNTARSALKMEAYRWTLSHLRPKKHGRNPDPNAAAKNEQLEGLFKALQSGPVE